MMPIGAIASSEFFPTVINLDQEFRYLGEDISYQKFDFPSGCEPHIKLHDIEDIQEDVLITCRIKSTSDLMLLFLCVDAVRRLGAKRIQCFIPYLPFARQDRVMVKGEPLSIKVIADLINAQGFEKIYIYDPHSEVSIALLNNVEVIENYSFVSDVLDDKEGYLIASPDAGAYKKSLKLCQAIGYTSELVLCNKIRDVTTGNISSITVAMDDLGGNDVYIVDDICDGGGTFTLLAKELKKRNSGKVYLVVSHGIFSKGTTLENIDHIYTTNSFKDVTASNVTQYLINNNQF